MPFFALNSVVIPIALGQCRRGQSKIGASDRAFSGDARNMARGYRRTWESTAMFQDYQIADNFIHLINGQGHAVRFGDGPTSSTGLSPIPGFTGRGMKGLGANEGFTFTGATGDYWSTGTLDMYLSPFQSFPDAFAWGCQFDDDKWTVILVVEDTPGFLPIIFRSDGDVFIDGVKTDVSFGFAYAANSTGYFITVRDGSVSLSLEIDIVPEVRVSDLIMLPYIASDYFVSQLSTGGGAITSIQVASVPVTGEVTGITYVQKPGQGVNNAKSVSFSLTEYLPGYRNDPGAATPLSPFDLPVLRLSGDVLSDGEGEITRIPVKGP